jgi:hypothetical protein
LVLNQDKNAGVKLIVNRICEDAITRWNQFLYVNDLSLLQ